MTQCNVMFVGPLPPPVHGFSEINRQMLSRLKLVANVDVFDLASAKPGTLFGGIGPWVRLLLLFGKFFGMAVRGKGDVLYLPLSGGYRQIIDACFAIVALLSRMRIVVHHHSFTYINRQPIYARAALRLLRGATHIVLCVDMGELLCDRYGISRDRLRTISNAAFLDGMQVYKRPVFQKKKLILGFLSNITAAKGCFDFIELVRVAAGKGVAVEGLMAGPVHPSIAGAFSDALASTDFVRHVGPVYGAEKQGFFEEIDLLVFPTRYENEAEPVTIWEAMEASVPVIALARGCIGGMLPSGAGWVIANPSQFLEVGVKHLQYLLSDATALDRMKVAARAEFEVTRHKYTTQLDELLVEITGETKN